MGVDPRDPRAFPPFADLRGLPPLQQDDSYEVMRPYVEHFAKRARQAGVRMSLEVWPGMQHEWPFTAQSGIELGQLKVPTILGIFE